MAEKKLKDDSEGNQQTSKGVWETQGLSQKYYTQKPLLFSSQAEHHPQKTVHKCLSCISINTTWK